jgi:hypothetical protein
MGSTFTAKGRLARLHTTFLMSRGLNDSKGIWARCMAPLGGGGEHRCYQAAAVAWGTHDARGVGRLTTGSIWRQS